ncbi:hypothetical protein E2986_11643 [Frieseomelitta varia]|uniref:Uncharacterized protein n=1 Tax=Frieseomelitta varia TaxID=561572 RepID=A0A833S419_9HYME|nr:hypothetical protein E2986_11643 [Frieseomelitta varia]
MQEQHQHFTRIGVLRKFYYKKKEKKKDDITMLIGYESGQIVFWDLKTKNADYRCQSDVPLRSISWHHEGKQFMCSHTDGSLSTWTVRQVKPTNVTHPHEKASSIKPEEVCYLII